MTVAGLDRSMSTHVRDVASKWASGGVVFVQVRPQLVLGMKESTAPPRGSAGTLLCRNELNRGSLYRYAKPHGDRTDGWYF